MITLHDVSKLYETRTGPRTVLDRVNLTVQPGQKLGILGCNGAGKSTLIRLMSGAEQPSSGKVHRGMSVSWPLAFTGGFQGSLTGADNLRFICRVYGADFNRALPFVESFSELGRYFREPFKTYSSGMRARLAFAVSMAVEFDCFLIDEIVAVGDARFTQKCHEELFIKRADRSVILVSHQPATVKSLCTSVVLLQDGKLLPCDSMDKAFALYEKSMTSGQPTESPAPTTPSLSR
jgi:capsular polysaccharide transport system ATP-binding protein